MNMQEGKKKIIYKALANASKRLRGKKSQFILGAEYDIPSSVISDIERAVKDPQLTTIFKLSSAFGLTPSQFLKELEKELPEGFSVSEE
ncbi:helix-turn-helix transcriptional regulator [bacterium]|nr:helix-turn-helix transcriptional regulator [bacterium]